MKALLRPGAARKLMAVSPRTFRRIVASGELPVVRPAPRCLRVRPEDLEAYLGARSSKAAN